MISVLIGPFVVTETLALLHRPVIANVAIFLDTARRDCAFAAI